MISRCMPMGATVASGLVMVLETTGYRLLRTLVRIGAAVRATVALGRAEDDAIDDRETLDSLTGVASRLRVRDALRDASLAIGERLFPWIAPAGATVGVAEPGIPT